MDAGAGRLDDVVPLENAAMANRTFIEWDKDDIDALGLMKVDVLALGMLSCIRKAFTMMDDLRAAQGVSAPPLALATLPDEDDGVFDMLCRGDSIGVFQVESRAQMNMLPRLKPACFYDLVIEVAIVRPGPIQGDMVHPYLRRRDGLEPEDYPAPHPDFGRPDELREVLGRTKGVPLFQEQAMKLAIVAAALARGAVRLHAWVYAIETGEVYAYDPEDGQYERIEGKLVPCQRGYHLFEAPKILSWIGPALWEAEYEGEIVHDLAIAAAAVLGQLSLEAPTVAWTSWSRTLRATVDALLPLRIGTEVVVEMVGDLGPPHLQHEAARSTQQLAAFEQFPGA